MTAKIRNSLLASTDLFDIEVAAFAKEVRDWNARETKVKEEEGRTDIEPIDRHHRYPAPTAHPLIAQSVDPETGLPDYEYVDDPIELTRERLTNEVTVAAAMAIDAILSPAKRRAMDMRHSDITKADIDRMTAAVEKHTGLLQNLKIKSIDYAAVEADVSAMRSDDDNAFLLEVIEKRNLLDRIHRKMIQAHSDIEDLTAETAGAYQLPKF